MVHKTLATWRKVKVEGEPYTLPSGLVVQVTRLNLYDLMKQGKVPQTLKAEFKALTEKDVVEFEELQKFESSFDIVFKCCVVSPRIVDAGQPVDEATASIDEFSLPDKVSVFRHANAVAADLEPFLETSTSA